MSRPVIAHQVQLEIRGNVTGELLRSESIMSGPLFRIAYGLAQRIQFSLSQPSKLFARISIHTSCTKPWLCLE